MAKSVKTVGLKLEVRSADAVKGLAKVEIELSGVNKRLNELKKQITIFRAGGEEAEKLTAELAKQGKTVGDLEKEYESLKKNQIDLRGSAKDLRKELREVDKAFKAQEFPEDSLLGLRKQYRELREELDRTSQSADKVKFDKLTADAERLKSDIKDIAFAVGDFRDNVGNYENAVSSALSTTEGLLTGNLAVLAAGLGVGGVVAQGFELIGGGVEQVVTLTKEFDTLRGGVQTLTNETGPNLNKIATEVLQLSETFQTESDEITKAIGTSTQQLSIQGTQAIDSIGQSLLAVNDQADFLDRVNTEMRQLTDLGIPPDSVFALLAEASNRNLNVDVLAEPIIRLRERVPATREALEDAFGAEATEELFKVFEERPLEAIQQISERLNELPERSETAGKLLADVFAAGGEDNVVAARSLATLKTSVSDLIDPTNRLTQRQLELQKVNREYAVAVQELTDAFGNLGVNAETLGTTLLTKIIKGVTLFIEGGRELYNFLNENREVVVLLVTAIVGFNGALIANTALYLKNAAASKIKIVQDTAAALSTGRVAAAQKLLNGAFRANPIGLVITAVGLLITGFVALFNRSETVRAGIAGLGNVAREVFAIIKEAIGSFVQGFNDIKNGNILSGLKSIGEGIRKTNPIGIAFTEGNRLKNAFVDGYQKKKAEEAVARDAKALQDGLNKLGTDGANSAANAATKTTDALDKGLQKGMKRTIRNLEASKRQLEEKLKDLDVDSVEFKNTQAEIKKIDEQIKSINDVPIANASISGLQAQLTKLRQSLEDNAGAGNNVIKSKLEEIIGLEKSIQRQKKNIDDLRRSLTVGTIDASTNVSAELDVSGTGNLDENAIQRQIELLNLRQQQQIALVQSTEQADTERQRKLSDVRLQSEADIIKVKLRNADLFYTERLSLENELAEKNRAILQNNNSGTLQTQLDIIEVEKQLRLQAAQEATDSTRELTATRQAIELEAKRDTIAKRLELENLSKTERAQLATELVQLTTEIESQGNQSRLNQRLAEIETAQQLEIQALNEQGLKEKEAAEQLKQIKIQKDLEVLRAKLQFADLEKSERIAIENEIFAKKKELAQQDALFTAQQIKELRNTALNATIEGAKQLTSALFNNQRQAIDENKTAEISALEETYEARLEAAEGNKAEETRLKAELEAEKKEIERKAAEERKKIAIKEALINAALAITKVFATTAFPASLIAAAGIGIQTAFQIAAIRAQKFARGGKLKGKSHAQGGTPVLVGGDYFVEAEKDELIVNKEVGRRKRPLGAVSAINEAIGNGLFIGGERPPAELMNPLLKWMRGGGKRTAAFRTSRKLSEGGGFGNAPQLLRPFNTTTNVQVNDVQLDNTSVRRIASEVATSTARAVSESTAREVGAAILNANRQSRREQRLQDLSK